MINNSRVYCWWGEVVCGAPEEQRLRGDRRYGAQSVGLPLQVRQFHCSGNWLTTFSWKTINDDHRRRLPLQVRRFHRPGRWDLHFFHDYLHDQLTWSQPWWSSKSSSTRPRRWSIFRAMRCRWFIFQQRCDTDYFLEKLDIGNDYFSIILLILGPIILRLFTDWLESSERKLF